MTLNEVQRLRAKLHGSQWNDTPLAERDAVYAMAERYAVLRSSIYDDDLSVRSGSGEWLYGDELDAAIDAAMKGGGSDG